MLSWFKQKERMPRKPDSKTAPTWMISSGHIKSDPGALPRISFLEGGCKTILPQKSIEIFTGKDVDVF